VRNDKPEETMNNKPEETMNNKPEETMNNKPLGSIATDVLRKGVAPLAGVWALLPQANSSKADKADAAAMLRPIH